MLELKNISKDFGDFVLKDLSFKLDKGDYFVLIGESGAGKSVILEIIAGLIKADGGEVFFNDVNITNQKIQDRKFGLLFQDYALFPHLSVVDNILYPIKTTKIPKSDKMKKAEELADELNIKHLLSRKPSSLSGGEQQRVALARTLIMEPEILLLDEPLSSLDVHLRFELRSILRRINQKGMTILHVTHDYEEVITLASKVGIIQDGQIIQTGTPDEVFHKPKSRFVAHLSGQKNFFKVTLTQNPDKESKKAIVNDKVAIHLLTGKPDGSGHVLIRSRDILLSKEELNSTASNNFKGVILDVIPSRFGMEICVDIGIRISSLISKSSFEKFSLKEGDHIWVSFKASAVKFYSE